MHLVDNGHAQNALWINHAHRQLPYAGAMNSFLRSLINLLISIISGAAEQTQSNTNTSTSTRPTAKKSHSAKPKPHSTSSSNTRPRTSPDHYQDPATSNRPRTSIREASIADALAHASYTPAMDGDADPGEVVWTWVPYQEDATVGKDRPAVVIGAQGDGVYILQLTSKNHTRDAAQEAAAGRYWLDIGAGDWDCKSRPSEVRLDRALWVKATDVRREGSILPKATWQLIVDALKEHYRLRGE